MRHISSTRSLTGDSTDLRRTDHVQPEVPSNEVNPSTWPVWANRGGGGPAKRLEAFDEAMERSKRKRSAAARIPDSEPMNVMAPTRRKKSSHLRRAQTNLKSVEQREPSAAPQPPQFLVPPGTEPNLQEYRVQKRIKEPEIGHPADSRFGFRPSEQGTARPNATVDHPAASSRISSSAIDPCLLGNDVQEDSYGPNSKRGAGVGDDGDDPCETDDELFSISDLGAREAAKSNRRLEDWELSPDEDDARALENLNKTTEGVNRNSDRDDDSTTEDVLSLHHAKNRQPRPPDPGKLNRIRDGPRPALESVDSDSDASDTQSTRAKRYSKTPLSEIKPKPSQLHFYPGQWRDVLELAKLNFRCWLACDNGFPFRQTQLPKECIECVVEAIQEHRAKGLRLEQGYWKGHKQDMAKVVFEDHSTYRGDGKKVAREIVRTNYPIFPDKNIRDPKTYAAAVAKNVSTLLQDGAFLHGGKDGNGRTDNFAHPALEELCVLFFYASSHKLSERFPGDFKDAVPQKAIALAATMIKCCLDEWRSGVHKNCAFTALTYRESYLKTVSLIETVEAHPYHGAKFLEMRKRWARRGRMEAGSDEAHDQEYVGFKVHLD